MQTDFPPGMFPIQMYALAPVEAELDTKATPQPEASPTTNVVANDSNAATLSEVEDGRTLDESSVWVDWDPVHVHTGDEVMKRLRAYAEACRSSSMASGGYTRDDGRAVIGMKLQYKAKRSS